ncbi:MAG: hypothetical protein GX879_00350 [Bacteroidales bacterium]|nr:hypothetical protein [Bacteroidales bacterium]
MFLLIFIGKLSYSQKKQHELQYAIDSVGEWLNEIAICKNQEERFKLNNYVISYMDMLLHDDASFTMNFDSVKFMRVIDAKGGNLRVYTWNIFLDNGGFKYFGYLQHKAKKQINVFMLNDLSSDTVGVNRSFISHKEWYGAMYYEIVEKTWNKHTHYVLIGWDGADNLTNRKVLEPLTFNRRGLPVFGDKIFIVGKEKKPRVIFEYAEMATMILRYNQKQDIIVIDHLVPSNPRFTGHYQYYGPDLSFDAFEYNMGRWYFISNIDFNKAINYEKKRKSKHDNIVRDY